MTTSRNLMYAILSMYAYNRGYGAGLSDNFNPINGADQDGLGENGPIGTAQLISRESLGIGETQYQQWKDAGFYAVSYSWNGQTIVAFRGTDNRDISNSASDIYNTWPMGGGDYSVIQGQLATSFLRAVPDAKDFGKIAYIRMDHGTLVFDETAIGTMIDEADQRGALVSPLALPSESLEGHRGE